jgi:hypothetical protein
MFLFSFFQKAPKKPEPEEEDSDEEDEEASGGDSVVPWCGVV